MSLSKNLSTILDAWPEARSQPFAGHDIANCIRNDLPNSIEGTFSESEIVNLKFLAARAKAIGRLYRGPLSLIGGTQKQHKTGYTRSFCSKLMVLGYIYH